MHSVLIILHVLVALALIGLILIQHGKGADVGAAFGSGASGTVFGARGSASFLTRTTAVLATVFFLNSFFLAYLASRHVQTVSVVEQVPAGPPAAPAQPPAPAPKPQAPVEVPQGPADVPQVPVPASDGQAPK